MTADLLQILQFSVVIFLCGKHCTLPYLLTSRLLSHMCMPLLGHCLHICHDVIGIHTCNDSIIIFHLLLCLNYMNFFSVCMI